LLGAFHATLWEIRKFENTRSQFRNDSYGSLRTEYTMENPPAAPSGSTQDNSGTSQTVSPDTQSNAKLRNALWKRAYKRVRQENPELISAFEKLIKITDRKKSKNDDAPLATSQVGADKKSDDAAGLTEYDISAVAQREKERMANKQWTYSWFGHAIKARDTLESILMVVKSSQEIIALGMEAAPPFVSLPWSVISILIGLVLTDFETTHNAVDGLKEITSTLASYGLAEREYLSREETKQDFENAVEPLYVAILNYQAKVALYFAKSTVRRQWANLFSKKNAWKDALDEIRAEELRSSRQIFPLGTIVATKGMRNLATISQNILSQMSQFLQQASAQRLRQEQIVDWISPINVMQDHLEVRDSLQDEYFGTGRWLVDDNEKFKTWSNSKNGTLLLQGCVGSGKSCLTSIVIQEYLQNSQQPVAYFYCSVNSPDFDRPRTIRYESRVVIRSLLAQCAVLSDGSIAESIETHFDKTTKKEKGGCVLTAGASLSALINILESQPGQQFTFVIDALDECVMYGDLLRSLDKVLSCKAHVRLFISSRYGLRFGKPFSEAPIVDISQNNALDIDYYIKSEVARRSDISDLSEEQTKRLISLLNKHAAGVFKWVAIILDSFIPDSSLQGDQDPKDIDDRLEKIERSEFSGEENLFQAYNDIYQHALGQATDHGRRATVKAALKWALCSFRPLSCRELSLALFLKEYFELAQNMVKHYIEANRGVSAIINNRVETVEIPDSIYPKPTFSQEDLELMERRFLRNCSNLLSKNLKGNISVSHSSVRQFFENHAGDEYSKQSQHLEVASLLVRFETSMLSPDIPLSHEAMDTLCKHIRATSDSVSSSFLEDYLRKYWSLHCKAAANSEELTNLINLPKWNLKRKDPLVSLHLDIAKKIDLAHQNILGDTWLHRAVCSNLEELILLLVKVDLTMEDSRIVKVPNKAGNLPLHLAAVYGNRTAFTLLIIDKADDQSTNAYFLTPLQIAIVFGRDDILKRAFRMRMKLDALDNSGNPLTRYAEIYGRTDSLQTLAVAGIPVHRPKSGKNAESTPALTMRTSWIAQELEDGERQASEVNIPSPGCSLGIVQGGEMQTSHSNTISSTKPMKDPPNIPKIVVHQSSICTTCDLQTWIRGGRVGLHYPINFQELIKTTLTCSLCSVIKSNVVTESIMPSEEEEPKVEVWVSLDFDAKVKIGKDLLRINTFGHQIIDLELFIQTKGQ
jgi:ankyrin repeat protein